MSIEQSQSYSVDNLKVEVSPNNFNFIADQPFAIREIEWHPFDYPVASSAMCAAYFIQAYCLARNIST